MKKVAILLGLASLVTTAYALPHQTGHNKATVHKTKHAQQRTVAKAPHHKGHAKSAHVALPPSCCE